MMQVSTNGIRTFVLGCSIALLLALLAPTAWAQDASTADAPEAPAAENTDADAAAPAKEAVKMPALITPASFASTLRWRL